MKKTFFALLLMPLLAMSQASTETATTGGMKFEHGLSWKEIQAKAKAENKFIIMDCFTTWCGPCKYMDKEIFPLKESGDFFNSNYINVRVQFDTTKNANGEIKDNEEVKAWFKDMEAINAQYKIRAYPTYLFFDPNGVAVHRAVGSSDVVTFITKGKDALEPEKQYYTQLKKYENGKKDPDFLRGLAIISQGAYDMDNANKISDEYIATQTDLYTKENLAFLDKFTSKSKDKGFAMMLENPEKVDAVIGVGKSKARVLNIINAEELYPALRKLLADKSPNPDPSEAVAKVSQKYPQFAADLTDMATRMVYNAVYSQEVYTPMAKAISAKTKVDWDAISTGVRTRDAKNADEMLSKGKMAYFQNTKDWSGYTAELGLFMTKFGEKATAAELNNYAWTVFDNCKDMACVNLALGWSERSIKDSKDPNVHMYMDTYANILHRVGRTKEAIEWQEKALALAPEAAKATYTATLNKMKNGEKTWAVSEE